MKKRKGKLDTFLYVIVIFILIAVITVCGVKVGQFLIGWHKDSETAEKVKKIVDKSTNEKAEFTHDTWNNLYAQNNDLVAYMIFPDGFCSQPIVQAEAKNNSYYLRRNFVTREYSTQGTVFMDCKDNINSQNITVYGHHVFYDDKAMFSPIAKLKDQNEYDRHHQFKVYYKDDVATYVITNVYTYDINKANGYDFSTPEFNEDYTLTQHIKYANDHNEIKPVATVKSNDDRIFSMQTCMTYASNERTIVVAKEISRTTY